MAAASNNYRYSMHNFVCSVPVVITGLTRRWALTREWSRDQLLRDWADLDLLVSMRNKFKVAKREKYEVLVHVQCMELTNHGRSN